MLLSLKWPSFKFFEPVHSKFELSWHTLQQSISFWQNQKRTSVYMSIEKKTGFARLLTAVSVLFRAVELEKILLGTFMNVLREDISSEEGTSSEHTSVGTAEVSASQSGESESSTRPCHVFPSVLFGSSGSGLAAPAFLRRLACAPRSAQQITRFTAVARKWA